MKKGLFVVLLLLIAVGASNFALAAPIVFTTPVGTLDAAGAPVSAEADFSVSQSGVLTLTLSNLQPGIGDAGQLLTGLFFTLSSGSASMTSDLGTLITIDSTGTITKIQPAQILGWGSGSVTGGFEVCVICSGGVTASATPSEGIIGPGSYPSSNNGNSIDGNGPHNPYVDRTATFQFTVDPGVTISSVYFSFGTQGNNVISAPEPASLSLLGAGLLGLGIMRRRRSKRA